MANLIEVNGTKGSVLVAVKTPPGAIEATADLDETIQKVEANVDDAFEVVERVVEAFHAHVEAFGEKLNAAEIEMGLSFTAKGSVYVVEATAEAAFKVTLKFAFV